MALFLLTSCADQAPRAGHSGYGPGGSRDGVCPVATVGVPRRPALRDSLLSTTLRLAGLQHCACMARPPGWRGVQRVGLTPYRLAPTGPQQPISWAFAQCQGFWPPLARPVPGQARAWGGASALAPPWNQASCCHHGSYAKWTAVIDLMPSEVGTCQEPLGLDMRGPLPRAPLRSTRFSNSSYSACGPIQNQYT